MKRLFALIVFGLLAACATQTGYTPAGAPASVAPGQAKTGDYWEYAVRDGYTGLPRGVRRYQVTQADANRVVVEVSQDGERVDNYVYAAGWDGIDVPLTNLDRWRYS